MSGKEHRSFMEMLQKWELGGSKACQHAVSL
jgi:hypothetical protein